jgi:hypothetical protein
LAKTVSFDPRSSSPTLSTTSAFLSLLNAIRLPSFLT